MLQYKIGQLNHPQIQNLIAVHLRAMHAQTPAEHVHAHTVHAHKESVHADTLDALAHPHITVYSAWHKHRLAGIAAINKLDTHNYELKSMRTASAFLRQGVASDLLGYIIAEVASMGGRAIFLETGKHEAFVPAHNLYEQFGFTDCSAFAPYRHDPLSRYMTRQLTVKQASSF